MQGREDFGTLKWAMIEDLVAGAKFFFRLPSFLRQAVNVEEARAILCRRLERREEDFLTFVRQGIYDRSRNPLRTLLRCVGCEYGDLARLVRGEGVEGALLMLFRRGVYLTVDEFKGRQPVRRGSTTFTVNPGQLRNPLTSVHFVKQSGGSRGKGIQVGLGLASVRDRAVNLALFLAARGGLGWRHALWGVPGRSSIHILLRFTAGGAVPIRWFSQVDPAAAGLHPRYRWSVRVMRWGSLVGGVPLPSPEYVSLEDPLPIARWMAETLRSGSTPHLFTFVSSAVRLCRVAGRAGIELDGAKLWVTGEPVTAERLAVIRAVGAEPTPQYGASESGSPIGYGCLRAAFPDDLHLLQDLHAMIQPGPDGPASGLPPLALLISSLSSTAPFTLLNVSLGDQAVMERRRCGCPLETLGWTAHLHALRSFEKLTAGGVVFLDAEVIRVLEEVLPSRFGGGPTDYQLVEDEAQDGQPRLRLLVHPSVGPLSPAEVADAFLAAVSAGSGAERVVGHVWRDGKFLRVERRPPLAMASGKILHLHSVPTTASGSPAS